MDFTQALVRGILDGGKTAYRDFLDRGIPDELLAGSAKPALDYLIKHFSEYGSIPGIEVIEGKLGIPMPANPPGTTAAFWSDEILTNAIGNEQKKAIDLMLKHLDQQEIMPSFEEMQKAVFRIQRLQVGGGDQRVTSMFEEGPKVWDHYLRMKKGERGILTPWKTINDSTLGFNAEELILFVARSGVGKTWASLQIAECAWKQEKRVLYVTTEMSKLRIALRFYAIFSKLPYGYLRAGQLDQFQEVKLQKYCYDLVASPNFGLIGGNFDFRIETLAAAIDEYKPDIVVIDGIYLIQVPGKDRIEKAANAFGDVKRLTARKKIPIVVTSQFNREVKVNNASTARAESVALTDAAVWHSTLIFGMVQTDDNKKDHRMQMKQLKVRDGAGEDFELNWNFETMDFSEVPKSPNAPGGTGGSGAVGDAQDVGEELGISGGEVPF